MTLYRNFSILINHGRFSVSTTIFKFVCCNLAPILSIKERKKIKRERFVKLQKMKREVIRNGINFTIFC